MPRWKRTIAVGVCMGMVALAVYFFIRRERHRQPTVTTENRIPRPKQLVAEQEIESAQAVATYLPANKTRIDDLNAQVA